MSAIWPRVRSVPAWRGELIWASYGAARGMCIFVNSLTGRSCCSLRSDTAGVQSVVHFVWYFRAWHSPTNAMQVKDMILPFRVLTWTARADSVWLPPLG
jgi:hypothetical protein